MKIKAISYTLLLLSIALTATAQPINWDSVRADYAQKYQVQQQPAWLFPIIFEEGGGQRDTLYLGYDEEAHDIGFQPNDTNFGEWFLPIDTSGFSAYWGSVVNDSVFKSIVRKTLNQVNTSFSISFTNGTLPLTVYWDKAAFYSDSLPFADQSPAPRAEGRLRFDLPMASNSQHENFRCPFDSPIFLTDTVQPTAGNCYAADSLYFFERHGNQNTPIGALQLTIHPWTGIFLNIEKQYEKDSPFQVSPNPFLNKITISNDQTVPYQLTIYNSEGQLIGKKERITSTKLSINTSRWSRGVYFLSIVNQNMSNTYKIIKSPN